MTNLASRLSLVTAYTLKNVFICPVIVIICFNFLDTSLVDGVEFVFCKFKNDKFSVTNEVQEVIIHCSQSIKYFLAIL